MFSEIKRDSLLLWGLFALLCAPCFFFVYSYHNDALIWMDAGWTNHRESGHLLLFSRPLGAILLDLQTNLLRQIVDLRVLNLFRFFATGVVGLTMFALVQFSRRRLGFDRWQSFFLVAVTFLQPAWLLGIFWASAMIPSVLAYALGIAAGLMIHASLTPSRGRMALGILTLICAFYIYPPAACCYFWIPLLLDFRSQESLRERFLKLGRSVLIFAAACGGALLIDRFGLKPMMCELWMQGGCATWAREASEEYNLQLAQNFLQKLGVLFQLMQLSASGWAGLFRLSEVLSLLPAQILAGFLVIHNFRSRPAGARSWAFEIFVLAAAGLLFNAPNLVTTGSVLAYRTLQPNSIFWGLGLAAVMGYGLRPLAARSISGIVCAVLAVAMFTMAFRSSHLAAQAWQQLSTDPEVIAQCQKTPADNLDRIDVVSRHNTSGFAKTQSLDFDLPLFLPDYFAGYCRLLGAADIINP